VTLPRKEAQTSFAAKTRQRRSDASTGEPFLKSCCQVNFDTEQLGLVARASQGFSELVRETLFRLGTKAHITRINHPETRTLSETQTQSP